MSVHVEIPSPYESAPGRFTVDLVFPAASKRRATQHHGVAWALAGVHGVEASTPFALNRRWSYYKSICGTDEKYGGLDERRLTVQGSARALARYLVALERVLDKVETLATRAVRVFGAWKRSAAAEPFLEFEDASTMRVRVREFRADALRVLVQGLDARRRPVETRDSSRPLWEQYGAVAEETWAAVGGVDLERVDEEAVTALVLGMVPGSQTGRAVVDEAQRLVVAEAARVEEQLLAERVVSSPVVVEAVSHGEAEADLGGQLGLFAYEEAVRPVPELRELRAGSVERRRYGMAA